MRKRKESFPFLVLRSRADSRVKSATKARIPVRREVAAACEILGFDPLHVANEGRLVAFVPGADADAALEAMRRNPYGSDAGRIRRIGPARSSSIPTTGAGGCTSAASP